MKVLVGMVAMIVVAVDAVDVKQTVGEIAYQAVGEAAPQKTVKDHVLHVVQDVHLVHLNVKDAIVHVMAIAIHLVTETVKDVDIAQVLVRILAELIVVTSVHLVQEAVIIIAIRHVMEIVIFLVENLVLEIVLEDANHLVLEIAETIA